MTDKVNMKKPAFKVNAALHGSTLQDALAQYLKLSRRKVKALLDTRAVRVNGKRVWMARHVLQHNDNVEWPQTFVNEEKLTLSILAQVGPYLVINKPAGILCKDSKNSVEERIRIQRGNPRLMAVHRLDRDTSGCLLIADGREAFSAAVNIFKKMKVTKIYRTIVEGPWPNAPDRITAKIAGKSAETKLRVLHAGPHATYLEINLGTGRTHQIRKHLAGLRHPVVGDAQYGRITAGPSARVTTYRQMLHASRLRLTLGEDREIAAQAPLPADFKQCMRELRLH